MGYEPVPASKMKVESCGPNDRSPASIAPLWAIASGKGGVGRSFLTANLALIAATRVAPCVAVDLDPEGGNLHTYLGLETVPAYGAGITDLVGRRTPLPDIPNLSYLSAVPPFAMLTGENPLTARRRQQLLRGLRKQPGSLVMMDLCSGMSGPSLDFFAAADRPILVLTPDPPAIESTHRFVRRFCHHLVLRWLRQVKWPEPEVRRLDKELRILRPIDMMSRLKDLVPETSQAGLEPFSTTRIHLIINQVRHPSEIELGQHLKQVVSTFSGIDVHFVGSIPYDDESWHWVRRRRLRLRESPGSAFEAALGRTVENLWFGKEIDPELEGSAVL